MMKRTILVLLMVMWLGADAMAQSRSWRGGDRGGRGSRGPDNTQRSTSGSEDTSEFGSKYGKIVEGNIFLKDRTPARPARSYEPTSRPTIPLEQVYVIVGIVFEDAAYRAYIEDLRTNTVTRLSPGDSIANGQVEEIGIGGLLYVWSGGSRWIEIGQDLMGSYPSTMRAPSGSVGGSSNGGGEGSSGATTAPAGPVDESTLSIQERMRLRRQQQLNRTGN